MTRKRLLPDTAGTATEFGRWLIMYGIVPTTLERAAAEILDRHGPDAVPILRECANRASELGDDMAAKAWRDIADAAERLVREEDGMGLIAVILAKDRRGAIPSAPTARLIPRAFLS